MRESTAIALVLAPIFSALFWRFVMRPLTGYLHNRIRSVKVRRVLFKRIG